MAPPANVASYVLLRPLAAGGMAEVHLGGRTGAAGFARVVAVKRLRADLAKDPEFAAMFLDEARLAARIRHANVASIVDVVAMGGELLLVMEYVHGESLARLVSAARERGAEIPLDIAARVITDVLEGLDAAHEATDASGEPLAIVHRDVAPHNVLVGADGVTRVIDFGIAKAKNRLRTTRDGRVRGRLRYMAPEHFSGNKATRRSDVYAASAVFWELVTGKRLFDAPTDAEVVEQVLLGAVTPPSRARAGLSAEIDRIALKGLALEQEERFASAREMARAITACVPLAPPRAVAEWVDATAPHALRARAALLAEAEAELAALASPPAAPASSAPAPPAAPASWARRRAPRRAIAIGAAAVAVGALAVVAVARARSGAARADAAPPAAPSASTASTALELAPERAAPASPAPPSPAAPAPRARAPRPARTAPRCQTPFIIDPSGHRIYRRECL